MAEHKGLIEETDKIYIDLVQIPIKHLGLSPALTASLAGEDVTDIFDLYFWLHEDSFGMLDGIGPQSTKKVYASVVEYQDRNQEFLRRCDLEESFQKFVGCLVDHMEDTGIDVPKLSLVSEPELQIKVKKEKIPPAKVVDFVERLGKSESLEKLFHWNMALDIGFISDLKGVYVEIRATREERRLVTKSFMSVIRHLDGSNLRNKTMVNVEGQIASGEIKALDMLEFLSFSEGWRPIYFKEVSGFGKRSYDFLNVFFNEMLKKFPIDDLES